MEVGDEVISIDCMLAVKGKNSFRWPLHKDIHQYRLDNIICHIEPPMPVNRRGDFILTTSDFENSMDILKEKII